MKNKENHTKGLVFISMKKGKPSALLPIAVFLVFYLGLGIYSEYILKIPMGFYNIPIVVAFLAAILVACLQNRSVPFEEKLALMGQGIGGQKHHHNAADLPRRRHVCRRCRKEQCRERCLFHALLDSGKVCRRCALCRCLLRLHGHGNLRRNDHASRADRRCCCRDLRLSLALCVASVMGGSMFGDNLSFISDTTIAACNGQGCEMKDKFRENFWIALPAALAALALILVISFRQAPGTPIVHEYHLLQMVPYLLVLIGGIAGIQVFVVLLIGIASGAVIMLGTGQTTLWDMLSSMGSGTSGMFETCMVAILVAAMCALIRENGGFTVLLRAIHKIFRGKKGGQLGVGILVALLDIATANNTVAIVMANPIAKQMSEDYGITPRKTASLLDTFSCISQGILPYGAQMLVAISAVHELGYELSAFEIMANLFYPGMLLVSSLIFIFVLPDRKNAESNA